MEKNDIISDELLAAYLDGNTNEAETLSVLRALDTDLELQEVLDIAMDIENDNVGTPDFLPMMKMAAESGENICSVLCEAYVLHKRGIPYDQRALLSLAQQNHWLTPQGTPLHSIGQLMAHYGLMITRRYDATLDDIQKALAQDNDVLVVVDSDKLYPGRPDNEDEPNHAIVVTAIGEDTLSVFDPQEPLHPSVSESIPRALFLAAWKESHNYMLRVLQTVDDYEPQPVDLGSIELTDDLQELQEAIAENAHEVWAAARMREGWTYGPVRDDANKKHPDLIPYSALPDSEKEYDRQMAFDTIKLVKKLGFDLIKKI